MACLEPTILCKPPPTSPTRQVGRTNSAFPPPTLSISSRASSPQTGSGGSASANRDGYFPAQNGLIIIPRTRDDKIIVFDGGIPYSEETIILAICILRT